MSIQHKNIPDAELHEPKGVATAVTKTTYWANGSGSGTWEKVKADKMEGLSGDGGVARLKMLTNGSNGFALYRDTAYGKMVVVDNSTPFAVTAAADPTLETASQYVLLTGSGAPFTNGTSDGVVFDGTNKLTFTYAGVYDLNFWSNITGFPSNTAKVSVRFRTNGTSVSPMHVWCKSNSNGDAGILAASDFITVAAGDYIQLMTASDTTGNIVFHNMNLTAKMLKAL
jgi:hypothetical protein